MYSTIHVGVHLAVAFRLDCNHIVEQLVAGNHVMEELAVDDHYVERELYCKTADFW
jgi:hypothetical protein